MKINDNRHELVTSRFRECFGPSPSIWARAPGRVDLMGSHTDYNLGLVLTLPVGHDTWIAARPREDRNVRLHSMNLETGSTFSLDHLVADTDQPWSNYVRGVASELKAEGLKLQGFDGVIHSILPMRSGLSSSAALECVTATIFEALGGWKLDPVRKALLCQRAENRFVGVNCGILDQYTSCAGREGCALLLDCRDLTSRPIKMPADLSVVMCDTGFKRELVGSEYGRRRAQCEEGARRLGLKALRELTPLEFDARERELPPEVARRCRFVIEENDRVRNLAEAIKVLDRTAIRRLTAASFRGACELYEIGVPLMQVMIKAMLDAPGVIGARQAGAGFGGCMVAFVEKSAVGAFADSVRAAYRAATQNLPKVYAVEAAARAGLVPRPVEATDVSARQTKLTGRAAAGALAAQARQPV